MNKRKTTSEAAAARLRRWHKSALSREQQEAIDTAMRWALIAAWAAVRRV